MAGKKNEVYVQKGRPWWKLITGILFSHLGELNSVIIISPVLLHIFYDILSDSQNNKFQLYISIGLFVLCISYAVGGAWVFMMLEKPYEEEQHQLKIVSSQKYCCHFVM